MGFAPRRSIAILLSSDVGSVVTTASRGRPAVSQRPQIRGHSVTIERHRGWLEWQVEWVEIGHEVPQPRLVIRDERGNVGARSPITSRS